MSKIKYIETKPINQILEFENNKEYSEFFSKRIKEILDYTFPNHINFRDYYSYERILLNKDGTPRKIVNPQWLLSKEAQKKQKKNWKAYLKKKLEKNKEKKNLLSIKEKKMKIEELKKEIEEIKKEMEKK